MSEQIRTVTHRTFHYLTTVSATAVVQCLSHFRLPLPCLGRQTLARGVSDQGTVLTRLQGFLGQRQSNFRKGFLCLRQNVIM